MPLTAADEHHLDLAISLADFGRGHTSPNPVVGAVVVTAGMRVGAGWHQRYGEPHAEVNAIHACGNTDLGSATLYVSLEPCAHEGRQPPCIDAIVDAGIKRVVVAARDPSDKVNGRGIAALRAASVDVEEATGALAARAREQNQAFRKHAIRRRPWVVYKCAASLDGRVATASGDSQWISGEPARALVHRWRSEVDAVAVGTRTVRADDPRLTARGHEVGRQPRRVVFGTPPADARMLLEAGGEVITVGESEAGRSPADRVVDGLETLGGLQPPVTSLLLEGGPRLAGAFLDAGEIDEIRFFLAPLIVGEATARSPIEGIGASRIADALRPISSTYETVGDDLLVTARLREW